MKLGVLTVPLYGMSLEEALKYLHGLGVQAVEIGCGGSHGTGHLKPEDYLEPSNADHKKQRGRTAPDRALSIGNIQKMMDYTNTIGMTVSICYWVRKQLKISGDMIPIINANGFQCLGYQSKLFNH